MNTHKLTLKIIIMVIVLLADLQLFSVAFDLMNQRSTLMFNLGLLMVFVLLITVVYGMTKLREYIIAKYKLTQPLQK